MNPGKLFKAKYIIVLALLALAAGAAWGWYLKTSHRPDVIIVVWDCVRADHVSHLGYSRPTTPTLDRLAGEGISFTRARTPAPWTLPAVAALLTGQPPWRSGAGLKAATGRNLDTQGGTIGLPPPETPFVTDWLAQRGYRPAAVSGNIYIGRQFFHGRKLDPLLETKGDARTQTDKALEILNDPTDDRPIVLYLHLMDAHYPTWPPEPLRTGFAPSGQTPTEDMRGWAFPNPPQGKKQKQALARYRTGKTALYDGGIRHMDDQLARLAQWADRNRAILVVVGDHGEELWDHQALEKAIYVDPRGISGIGHGHALFEELLHVPLVIWKKGLNRGLTDAPADLTDIWPTLAGMLGEEPPSGLPGRDVLQPVDPFRVMIAGGIGYGNAKYAALRRPWKLIVSHGEEALLFNLDEDPGESTNRLAEDMDLADALLEHLLPVVEQAGEGPRRTIEVDESTAKRLKALGYM